MSQTEITKLRNFGYQVEVATETEEENPDVLHISGYGISLYVSEDDHETLTRLANPKAHEHRLLQHEGEEDREKLVDAELAARVSLGDLKKSEVAKERKAMLGEEE